MSAHPKKRNLRQEWTSKGVKDNIGLMPAFLLGELNLFPGYGFSSESSKGNRPFTVNFSK